MKTGVVFVSYRIPAERLKLHFNWNQTFYRESRATVYVVTDENVALPRYCRCLPFGEPMEVFSLCRTANYGIRRALEDGCDPIVKLDVDTAINPEAWEAMLSVRPQQAVVPIYRMADSFDERATKFVEAPLATGQVAMSAANWRRIAFDERLVGYGADDGILLADIQLAGLEIDRRQHLDHIAHQPGTPQREGHGRSDHWNRGSINPDNGLANANYIIERRARQCGAT